uniref:Syncollin, tandem duplicate 1 n=2 Tax=Latimeria chalumnae TaxID=7897 RepID=H3B493_LATCH
MELTRCLLIFPFLLVAAFAQCPASNQLKSESGEKVCARMFEHSSYYYDQSCTGKYLDAMNGDDFPFIPLGWNNRISSLVVSNRCELLVWSISPKRGSKRRFTGVVYHLKEVQKGLFGNWNDSISSYYCTCK